jgi:NADH-quinone oxidoreductase subunit G
VNAATAAAHGLTETKRVRVRGSAWSCELDLALDDTVPAGCVRVSAGWPQTAPLGTLSGILNVEAL